MIFVLMVAVMLLAAAWTEATSERTHARTLERFERQQALMDWAAYQAGLGGEE